MSSTKTIVSANFIIEPWKIPPLGKYCLDYPERNLPAAEEMVSENLLCRLQRLKSRSVSSFILAEPEGNFWDIFRKMCANRIIAVYLHFDLT